MVYTRWITGDRSQSVSFIYEDIEIMWSYTILKIMSLIANYEVSMERRYGYIRCIGGTAPTSTIPSTTQRTIQSCEITKLHARITMPNSIPSHTASMPQLHISRSYVISHQRCNDLYRGGWLCRNRNNPYRELPHQNCRNEVRWNAFTNREG